MKTKTLQTSFGTRFTFSPCIVEDVNLHFRNLLVSLVLKGTKTANENIFSRLHTFM